MDEEDFSLEGRIQFQVTNDIFTFYNPQECNLYFYVKGKTVK